MEASNETNDQKGQEAAKSEAAEPKAETLAGEDSKAEAKDAVSNDVPDQSKGNDAKGADSASKDDEEQKEGETGKESTDSLDNSNPSEAAETTNVDDSNKSTDDDNKTESKSCHDDNIRSNDSDVAVDESSLTPSSPPSQEPAATRSEDIQSKSEESTEKTTEEKETQEVPNKPVEKSSDNIEGTNTMKEEVAAKEYEETSGDVSTDEPKPDAADGTDETEKKENVTEKEDESKMSDQQSQNSVQMKVEKKEAVSVDQTESNNTDESLSADKAKMDEDNANPKVDAEITVTKAREVGNITTEKESTAMEIETELVQSNGVKAEPDPIEKTSLIPDANNTPTEVTSLEKKDDTFRDFQKKGTSKKKKSKKKRLIKIKIPGMSTELTKTKMANVVSTVTPDKPDFALSCHDSLIPENDDAIEKELEDSLAFFEQPHEDQDPMFIESVKKEKRDRILLALKNIQIEEDSGKKQIGAIVSQQLKERQASTERYIEKHRVKIATDQKNDLTRLQQQYTTKSRSNKVKIDQSMQALRKKQAEESQKYMQQHRQQVQQRRLPEQVANAQWQEIASRLNSKHSRVMHDFSRRGKEVMKKYELEYERERTRITKAYEKRGQDLNTQRQNLYNRIYTGLQQIKQRHVKKHLISIAERRTAMKLELDSMEDKPMRETAQQNLQTSPDKAKSGTEERQALRPVSPIKTATDWREESVYEPSGAATRHKHRKGVLSQINRQLSVEIHNEGIWLSELSEKKNNQNRTKDSSDNAATTESDKKYFFPWGVKARKILESIVCGEIPFACNDSSKFNFSDTVAQNGGHIRCIMTDLRTSDATASAQRAEAIMKKELEDVKKLEEKEGVIKKNMGEMEKNIEIIRKSQQELNLKLKQTVKEYEKTKQHLQAFRTKYSNFFGPDGKPLPTNDPNDTRKLTQHGLKYKMAIESSEKRAVAIKNKMKELQESLQKRETNNRNGSKAVARLNAAIKSKKHVINEVRGGRLNLLHSKSIDNPSIRVTETINILGVAADMRRDQLNQKRNHNTSSQWVQSLPGLSASLRRSLWFKMHRRRQQIVLRPTFSSMLTNMRKEIETKLNSIDTGIRRNSKEATQDKLIKAEQAYLLVTHPVEEANEHLPSLPSSSEWAEPGWYLKLGVEKDDSVGDRILPCHPQQPLVQHNLSELYSAPGRQAASMISSTHLRSLETPLSAVATATSLSETDPAMAKPGDQILSGNDPLRMTRDAHKLGYAFSVSKTPARPTVARRKSSSTKETSSSTTSKATKKKAASASSDSGVSKASATSATLNATKMDNSRKRKTTTQANHSTTPRAVQRKRTEPSRQIPVDDQAFQPRPIMTQPQQQQQPAQPSAPFLQQAIPQQQQNPYNNQFMNTIPSPVAPQQQATHRGSFNQFQNNPQMNQFRMMQQQQSHHQQQHHHQQHGNQQKVGYGQMQQQTMRPNPQFFPQMGQQQFAQQPMQMPGQGGMQMNMNNAVRQNMGQDEQNDPLFMLK